MDLNNIYEVSQCTTTLKIRQNRYLHHNILLTINVHDTFETSKYLVHALHK